MCLHRVIIMQCASPHMFGVMAQEQCAESVLLIHHEDSKKDHNMSFLSSLSQHNKMLSTVNVTMVVVMMMLPMTVTRPRCWWGRQTAMYLSTVTASVWTKTSINDIKNTEAWKYSEKRLPYRLIHRRIPQTLGGECRHTSEGKVLQNTSTTRIADSGWNSLTHECTIVHTFDSIKIY